MKASTLLFYLICVAAACGAGVNFPTNQTSASPDSKWFITSVSEKNADGYVHKLFLHRNHMGIGTLVYATGRSCDVLWSDEGNKFAITDWSGSSTAEVYIVALSNPGKAEPLETKSIARIVSKDELGGHCYFEALNWEDANHLRVKVFGHTDETSSHSFSYYFSIDISSGEAKLLKKTDQESKG